MSDEVKAVYGADLRSMTEVPNDVKKSGLYRAV